MIDKLLGAATAGSTLAGVGLLHRFLSGIASIVILSIVSAFMLCALLAVSFCMAYLSLVHYGLDPYAAGIAVGIAAFCITLALVAASMQKLRQLGSLSHPILQRYGTNWPDIGKIADAFIDGLLNHKK